MGRIAIQKLITALLLEVSFSIVVYTQNIESFTSGRKSEWEPKPLDIHGLHQDFIRIPSGSFLMGSDGRPDEQPVHNVRVGSFDLASTEVTVRQFRAFVQATGYRTDAESSGSSFACCWRPKIGISWHNPGFLQDDNEPVVAISWNDAHTPCRHKKVQQAWTL